jgi:hypothetical protein
VEVHKLDDIAKQILADNIFVKTIYGRCSEENPQYELIKDYNIPIPKLKNDCKNIFDSNEVLNVVNRLKEIENKIDWKRDNNENYNIQAIRFLSLIEAIAGKRYSSKLSYLIWR